MSKAAIAGILNAHVVATRAQADDGLVAYTNGVANDALEAAAAMLEALSIDDRLSEDLPNLIREMKQ